jgi:hypothetical protein
VFTSLTFSFYVILYTFLHQFQQGTVTKKLCPSLADQEGTQESGRGNGRGAAAGMVSVNGDLDCAVLLLNRASRLQ